MRNQGFHHWLGGNEATPPHPVPPVVTGGHQGESSKALTPLAARDISGRLCTPNPTQKQRGSASLPFLVRLLNGTTTVGMSVSVFNS